MPLVQVDQVHKSFQRRGGPLVQAINGVSFAIGEGETLGLIGESGSGKSTMGKIVLGLLTPDAGRVSFSGRILRACARINCASYAPRCKLSSRSHWSHLIPACVLARLSRNR